MIGENEILVRHGEPPRPRIDEQLEAELEEGRRIASKMHRGKYND